jgi:hypothetical protein
LTASPTNGHGKDPHKARNSGDESRPTCIILRGVDVQQAIQRVHTGINMPDYILSEDLTTGTWHRVKEELLPNEARLQELVNNNPDILPLDDLGTNVPPLLIVAREAALLNGYVDVIGVDRDGLITIIECKLDSNPEVKRKVIGQILGYAGYLWGMTYETFESTIVRPYFSSTRNQHIELKDLALGEAMEHFVGDQSVQGLEPSWSQEAFRQQLTVNLKEGHFRLLIVVDKVNDELRRTVEYLNACTDPNFQVLCAELRYFATEHTHLLVPALIGKPAMSKTQNTATTSMWTFDRFMHKLKETGGDRSVEIAQHLYEWSVQNCDEVKWGNGIEVGVFYGVIARERSAVSFIVRSDSKVEITFQYLKPFTPFDKDEIRSELLNRIKQNRTISLPANSINGRPNFPMSAISGEAEYNQFISVMEWVIKLLREGSIVTH